MSLHRDPRHDRRRRLLREVNDVESTDADSGKAGPTRRSRVAPAVEQPAPRRNAGYSQDVRGACGQRLVQLIPVRRRSMAAVMLASLLIPVLLMYAHYMVYVSGDWPWYGHPLAVCLDASHPQGLAAWFSSHLWLLCLGTTILTFQLRRHKLDDYQGEYRLWFWLVITCLLGSFDATTHVSDLFAASMDGWCRSTLGWSGPAVFRSVVVVLIGLLGLRMCSELKVVPFSLLLWLVGLTAWVASAALGRDELKLEISIQFRIWLRCGLWLAGLTTIWLAGLTYLRHVYIEAQRRFLLRGKLASSAAGIPLAERVRGAWHALPPLHRLKRGASELAIAEVPRPSRRKSTANVEPTATDNEVVAETGRIATQSPTRHVERNSVEQSPVAGEGTRETSKKRGWGWLRAPKDQDEDAEFRKVNKRGQVAAESTAKSLPPSKTDSRNNQPAHPVGELEEPAATTPRRWWLPRIPAPKLGKLPKPAVPRVSLPRMSMPKMKLPTLKLPKLGLPKFNLSGLRLNPPDASNESTQQTHSQPAGIKPVDSQRPLPGTSKPSQQTPPAAHRGGTTQSAARSPQNPDYDQSADDDQDFPQTMSKAERKRLRRQQQQNRAA